MYDGSRPVQVRWCRPELMEKVLEEKLSVVKSASATARYDYEARKTLFNSLHKKVKKYNRFCTQSLPSDN